MVLKLSEFDRNCGMGGMGDDTAFSGETRSHVKGSKESVAKYRGSFE